MQEGDLDSAIKKYKGYLPEDDIMLKFVQIALALHYIHSKVKLLLLAFCCLPCTSFLIWPGAAIRHVSLHCPIVMISYRHSS